MTVNTELFRKIRDQISAEPERHSQATWECGTTRCVAGWAVAFELGEGRSLYQGVVHKDPTPDLVNLLDRLQVYTVSNAARVLLGLSYSAANLLFFADNEVAREAVALYAEGRDQEAVEALVQGKSLGEEL